MRLHLKIFLTFVSLLAAAAVALLLWHRLTASATGAFAGAAQWTGGGAIFCLGALASWIAARRLTEPLRRAADAFQTDLEAGRIPAQTVSLGDSRELRTVTEAVRSLSDSLAESRAKLERSYLEAVSAVVLAIDARDNETTGHSLRVARITAELGRRCGLSGAELLDLERGALLHDIGKIAVPDAVLRKPAPLTDAEWHIMRQHPSWGADILANVSFLAPARDVVQFHQERWDGSGYPFGLVAEEIPRAARIFAVVDTYDAITSDRAYRPARSHEEALEELRRVAGSQLDPEVVEIFETIPAETLKHLRRLRLTPSQPPAQAVAAG